MSIYANLILTSGEVNGAVLNRVADWLEANPDKHITGGLATNDQGFYRSPNAPDASCFCVIGRICVEAAILTSEDGDDWDKIVQKVGIKAANPLWRLNDEEVACRPKVAGKVRQGNPKVIAALRRLVNEQGSAT